jgi:hypothetical protein
MAIYGLPNGFMESHSIVMCRGRRSAFLAEPSYDYRSVILEVTGKVMGKVTLFWGSLENVDVCKSLILLVPKEGAEPSWPQGPRDFESELALPQIAAIA